MKKEGVRKRLYSPHTPCVCVRMLGKNIVISRRKPKVRSWWLSTFAPCFEKSSDGAISVEMDGDGECTLFESASNRPSPLFQALFAAQHVEKGGESNTHTPLSLHSACRAVS